MSLSPMINLFTGRINSIKKIAFTLLLALTTTVSTAQTHTGNLTLSSQTAIDTFNFIEVVGTLTINDSVDNNITNLNGLRGLTQVGGDLLIGGGVSATRSGNYSLMSLSGLDSLASIGGDLRIQLNNSLTSLSGLDALTEIEGYLNVRENDSLLSLSGLESLTSVGGYLQFFLNNSLTSLSGLDALTSVEGDFNIIQNNSLSSLNGLDTLTLIGGNLNIQNNSALSSLNGLEDLAEIRGFLQIHINPSLSSLNGLEGLDSVGGDFNISQNPFLSSLSGLDDLILIGGNLHIVNNTALSSLSGLEDLTEIRGGLNIQNNTALSSLNGLEDLAEIRGFLQIHTNSSLLSLNGLDTLTLIGGNLNIQENPFLSSLSGLEDLTEISGGLNIQNNPSLSSLNGLDTLTSVGESVQIYNNDSLTSLSGLGSLTEIGGNLTIQENPSLSSLNGLDALTLIGGDFNITQNIALLSLNGLDTLALIGGDLNIILNPALSSLNGLEGLAEIRGDFNIIQNNPLSSLNGLGSLTEIGGNLIIQENAFLTSLNGLNALTSVGESLQIYNNDSLTSLSGLEDLTTISGDLNINTNPSLSSLNGLNTLTSIGGNAYINVNFALSSLSGLDALTSIGENLQIANNDSLTSLSGLEDLTTISGDLNIQNNPSLSSLNGLDTLTLIGGDLNIIQNPALTSLSGLDALTSVGANLQIANNPSLSSLSGLDSLIEIGGTLSIYTNVTLTDFCAIYSLIGDGKSITNGEYTVNTNRYNPSYAEIQVMTSCFVNEIILTSQDDIDAFTATEVIGNLAIEEAIVGDITNLNNLSSLTSIEGQLRIKNNTALTSLGGLGMLDAIEGMLIITGNTDLIDFCAISSLVGDESQITKREYIVSGNDYNPSYSFIQNENLCSNTEGRIFDGDVTLNSQDTINAFDKSYRVITGNLTINDSVDGNIRNLDSLSGLTLIGGNLLIGGDISLTRNGNFSLTSLSGLDSLTYIGGNLDIHVNTSLTSLSGLDALTEIGRNLSIYSNAILRSLNGLETLTKVGGLIIIENNNSLISLSGLGTLREVVGNLWIQNNDSLTSLGGLEALTEIGGTFLIRANNSLTSLSGLDSLSEIGGFLSIQSNISLTSLSGLDSLTEIGGSLSIQYNDSLTSLNGLEVLTAIGGTLDIQYNNFLISLFGLRNLMGIGSHPVNNNLRIINNRNLIDMCVFSALVTNDPDITADQYEVTRNGYNPSYTEIQTTTRCSFDLPVVIDPIQNISTQLGTIIPPINLNLVFSDPNGDSLTYTAISSNRTVVEVSVNDSTLTLMGVGVGTAMITVSATDGIASVSDEFMVTITNTAPTVATALTDVAIESGTAFETIDISATFSDPNGDALTYTVASSDAAIVTAALNNTTLTLTETGKGTATITVTASDAFGLSVDTSFEVIIMNTAPTVVTRLTEVAIVRGMGFEAIDLSTTFSDANGDMLSYTVASSDENIVSGVISGTTLTLMEVGAGTAMITVTATDGIVSISDEFMVTITNTAPTVATRLTAVAIERGMGFEAIDLSTTFSDANGDMLSYTVASSDENIVSGVISSTTLTLMEVGAGTATITVTATDGIASISDEFMVTITNTAPTVATRLTAVAIERGMGFEAIDLSTTFSDANGDMLSYTVASSDENIVSGVISSTTLTLMEVGAGTATITVTATDGIASISDEFMVTITNTAPTVATRLTAVAIERGMGFETIDLSTTFSDANGDVLSYTVASSDENIVSGVISGTTLTLMEVGAGTAMITVTATDGIASISDEFMVSITNTAPTVATRLTAVAIERGMGFEAIDLSTTFSDANGDMLSYTVASSDENIVSGVISGTTLTLMEVGVGTAMITVTASDGIASISDEFMVTITNTAPTVATRLTAVAIERGMGFEAIDLSTTFSDANGDMLSYTVASSDENIVSGVISGTTLTLMEVGVGTAMITVTASDGIASISDEFMVSISRQNNAPIRTGVPLPTLSTVEIGFQLDPTIDLTAFFSDPDNDVLRYTATVANANVVTVAIEENTRLALTAIGIGTTEITIKATDSGDLSISDLISITVKELTLGIADTDILAVYPNPSSGIFQFSRTVDRVRVYDMSGRLVYQGKKIKQLDLTSKPIGQYLVEMHIGNERGRYTIIKE